ncbi:helix-turn-helix domain-containing protein [Flavobacterium fluviatile]|uniref:helix-turn-helix domain-containing protein n=1 Tax=Flavobacterium fluviatile TaxID=1862387 RepID=UPI0013D0807A|nr:AraC family transcriptional regulator [Flavobacterium fluviatile]
MKKINLALPYFVKVDQTFNNKNYLRPDLREMYELLIKYYKDKNDYKTQLYYINQLLKVDAVLDDTYKYLIGIHKEYSTEKLLAEKEKIDNKTLRQKYYTIIMISISSIILIVATWFAYRYTKNRNRYKNNYKKQKAQFVNAKNTPTAIPEKPQILNINPDTVSAVLKQLEKFEKDKKFLERDWTLVTLAAALKSNPKYLSSIISHYREKGFTDYINEICIDYITTLLYTERKFSNYTYTALAEEAGFSSTQRFTNAFLAKTGMPPSFFIRQIRKEQL